MFSRFIPLKSTRLSITKEPMKPPPPVTRTRLSCQKVVISLPSFFELSYLPIHTADPAVSVLGVPANCLSQAFFPRMLRLPASQPIQLGVIHP